METNIRSRCFALILYKDSENYDYNKVLEYITTSFDKYAYIEHLPEKDETKKHTHVLLYFTNKRWLSALSKELGIPQNYIQSAKLKPYLKYLIHFDNEEKIQYSIEDVKGTLNDLLVDLISDNSELNNFSEIFLYIQSYEGKLSFTTLTSYIISKNMYSTYRRNINAIRILINEHNNVY